MSSVVELKSSSRSPRDPALDAIDNYLAALETWRDTDRRLKRLRKKLPEELMRRPRVQMSMLLKGRDKFGADIKEPIYAHSEWEIKQSIYEDRKLMLSLHAGPSWAVGDSGRVRRSMSPRSKAQRPIVFAKYKERLKDKIEAFRADEKDLHARQQHVGWRQAVEAEDAARGRVFKLRYALRRVTPTTMAGAIALAEIIYVAYRMEENARTPGSPYGLGECYSASIARSVANFLKLQDAERSSVVKRFA